MTLKVKWKLLNIDVIFENPEIQKSKIENPEIQKKILEDKNDSCNASNPCNELQEPPVVGHQ